MVFHLLITTDCTENFMTATFWVYDVSSDNTVFVNLMEHEIIDHGHLIF